MRRTIASKTGLLREAFRGQVGGKVWVVHSNGKGRVGVPIKEDHGVILLRCDKCEEWRRGILFVMSRWSSGALCSRCKVCRSRKNTAQTMLDKEDAKLNTSYKRARAREKNKLQRGLTELHKVYARHKVRYREYSERVQEAHGKMKVVDDKLWKAFQYQRSKLVEEIEIERHMRSEASHGNYPTFLEAQVEVSGESGEDVVAVVENGGVISGGKGTVGVDLGTE